MRACWGCGGGGLTLLVSALRSRCAMDYPGMKCVVDDMTVPIGRRVGGLSSRSRLGTGGGSP